MDGDWTVKKHFAYGLNEGKEEDACVIGAIPETF